MKNSIFGKIIKDKRLEKNIGLNQFARMVGTSNSYMSQLENGLVNPPSEAKIIKMAEILGLDKDNLLALDGRVAMDIQEKIMQNPIMFGKLLRKLTPQKLEKHYAKLITPRRENPPLSRVG